MQFACSTSVHVQAWGHEPLNAAIRVAHFSLYLVVMCRLWSCMCVIELMCTCFGHERCLVAWMQNPDSDSSLEHELHHDYIFVNLHDFAACQLHVKAVYITSAAQFRGPFRFRCACPQVAMSLCTQKWRFRLGSHQLGGEVGLRGLKTSSARLPLNSALEQEASSSYVMPLLP
jgi:hypothetical protein